MNLCQHMSRDLVMTHGLYVSHGFESGATYVHGIGVHTNQGMALTSESS